MLLTTPKQPGLLSLRSTVGWTALSGFIAGAYLIGIMAGYGADNFVMWVLSLAAPIYLIAVSMQHNSVDVVWHNMITVMVGWGMVGIPAAFVVTYLLMLALSAPLS